MLTAEENEVLCRVGPGTPMGKVLRRFWTPAFQLDDLPAPDCPPIRVTVLGENFVALRDTDGRLGVLDELCCHRGASSSRGNPGTWTCRCPGAAPAGRATTTRRGSRSRTPRSASTTRRSGTSLGTRRRN